jgi:hypothetical protein
MQKRLPRQTNGMKGIWRRIVVLRISAVALVRHSRLFFRACPGTPLRVLCVVAFDTFHEIRFGEPMPRENINYIAHYLVVAASRNALLDNKPYSTKKLEASHRFLERPGLVNLVEAYVGQLEFIEKNRPTTINRLDWNSIRCYRERVVCLSIETICELGKYGTRHTWRDDWVQNDPVLSCLFRLAILLQIADDFIDVGSDLKAQLPTFITVACTDTHSPEKLKLLIRSYSPRDIQSLAENWLFRLAVSAVCLVLELAVLIFRLRPCYRPRPQHP